MSFAATTTDALRNFASNNIALKATALALAVLMFSLVRGAEDLHRSVYVDVAVQPPSGSDDLILVSDIPDRVRLRIKGSRSRLNSLRPENLPAVEVRPRSSDDEHFYFEEQLFDLPAGIEITEVTPASFDVRWAKNDSKWVKVELVTSGELHEELEWESKPVVKPDAVRAEGPGDVVNALGRVRTVELDLAELAEGPSERDIRLVGPPANTKFNAQQVSVSWHARIKTIQRTLAGITLELPGSEVALSRPARVTLRVTGPKKVVEKLSSKDLVATVDGLEGVPQNPVELPVVIRGLPPRVELVRMQPKKVTVVAKVEEPG